MAEDEDSNEEEEVEDTLENEPTKSEQLKEIRNTEIEIQKEKLKAEEQRQLQRLQALEKGPARGSVLGAQVGAYLGFTREGVAGADIAKQKIRSQTEKVREHKKLISTLNEQRVLKIKQAQSDGVITDTEKTDINALINKISGYEQKADVERNILSKLQTERSIESKFQYMSPTVARKLGIITPKTRKKPLKIKKKFLTGTKKKHVTQFEKDIGKLQQEPQIPQPSELTDDEIQQTKPQPVKRNQYGVDDWIMKI